MAKKITQKHYELLSVNLNEAELAHLYYLLKAHKAGSPLRPIMSGLRHPAIKISKFLDNLLRPLFDQMAKPTTIDSGFELIQKLNDWSSGRLNSEILFCAMDVTDLYTMIPQIDQIRGGAMGSPLTLTMTNCDMFFFEREIVKQISNSGGLYLRYKDDILLTINCPERHLLKQIEKWNHIDTNIKLTAHIGKSANFLDLFIENQHGSLVTYGHHKPSYETFFTNQ